MLIKTFYDDSVLEYDRGKFDEWCVYLSRPDKSRYAPTDLEYFTFFQKLSKTYGKDRVYQDFVHVYEETKKQIDQTVLDLIDSISKPYDEHDLDFSIYMTVIYMGMIAEENKRFTRLGKRVKRLGFYQTVILGHSPISAAHFSRGKKWREIDEICKSHGF